MKKPKKPNTCKHYIALGHCLLCAIQELPKVPKPKKVKKVKKEPPAKCGLCRRRLIPGDGGTYCMTCQHRMDNEGR